MASMDTKNHSTQSIISVGIIGCSNHSLSKQWVCKQLISNQMTNSVADDTDFLCDPFQWMRGLQSVIHKDRCSQKSMLSIYDDIESGTIYYNLKSHSNLEELNKLLTVLCAQSSQYEFHRILQSTENIYLKSLIYIFLSCHHILLFQSTSRFNPQWLSIFRFLQEMKLKLISPIIGILQPIFAHIVAARETDPMSDEKEKESVMKYLSSHNLPPFIIPVLTFFYPSPNTNGSLVLDTSYSTMMENDMHSGNRGIIQKAVLRKFTTRLQQQICVLLRRCHAIFPYFQTGFDGSSTVKNDKNESKSNSPNKPSTNKYGAYTSLSHCIEELDALGFGVCCYLDEEIYSTHSRWIETDDMMHTNPLSLFCLLPHRFIQIYTQDTMNCIQFLFIYHESLINDTTRLHRDDSTHKMSRVEAWIKAINNDIVSYLRGESSTTGKQSNKEKKDKSKESQPKQRWMPSRQLYYVSTKQIYDSLFKNIDEMDITNAAFLRIYNVFNYDSSNRKRKNKKFYSISSMEKGYSKIAVSLDIDRLARYSSLLCRRAYKSARGSYLRDLPDMYPATLHSQHIKLAMKVFRQQSIAPLQEYYCRQLYAELTQIWKAGGRQACDAVSLTGRPCCRPIHDGKNINLSAMKKNESAKFAEERHSKFGQDPLGHFSGFSSSHACNCGRTILKREDPFDLYAGNISYFNAKCCQRVQWNYQLYVPQNADQDILNANDGKLSKQQQQQSHYNDGFNLCNHGGAELYHKQTGITQPGFDRYNCFLLRWDIPIASNVYIFHQHYKQKNQRYRDTLHFNKKNKYYKPVPHAHIHEQNDENLGLWLHKIRKTVAIANNKPNSNAYFPCFVGLEFECYRGHRGILDLHEISSLSFQHPHSMQKQSNPYEYQSKFEDDESKDSKEQKQKNMKQNQLRFVATEFPIQNVPLRVPCKQCWNIQKSMKGKNINIINAQLQRAFIVTPPPPISITAQPVIISAFSDAIFEFDTPVVLPPSSFLVLRFPYIYFHDGRGLPPDKLSLSRGMLTVAHNTSNHNHSHHHSRIHHAPHLSSKKIVIKKNEKR
eukprot:54534_1